MSSFGLRDGRNRCDRRRSELADKRLFATLALGFENDLAFR